MSGSKASSPAWLKGFLARYRSQVCIALALGFAAFGCAALLMFTSGYLISATALAGTTLFSIMVPVACVQLFGFGRPLARYLERLVSHDWVLHVTSDLRLRLFRSISRRTGDPARARATGEYLGLLADDVAHLQNLYLRVVFPSAIAYALALGASVLFGFFSLPFALIVVLSLALVATALPFCSLLSTRALAERVKSDRAREYEMLADDVYGAVDWVLAGRGEAAMRRHARADARVRALDERTRLLQRLFALFQAVLLALLLGAVLVWAGTTFGADAAGAQSRAAVNWIAAFALGFFPLIDSFATLPSAFSESTAHLVSIRRLDEYLDEDADDGGEGAARGADGDALPPDAGDDAGRIELRDVSYTYPGSSHPTLDGLTLAVEPGESVAVLGRSGAGKSTFARVLCGELPAFTGMVRVSGAAVPCGGEAATADGARPVGFVGQSPYLFNRTLRDNLTLGVSQASDAELTRVLRSVGLGRRLEELPDGLNTVIGESGVGFSGGEEHRIAIARVLVAQAPVVVVDEPFSALDPATERDLLDTLLEAFANRTLVVITHHLAEIDRFDRVFFIEDGHLDLHGAPADLMATSSRFRNLVEFDRNHVGQPVEAG